MSPSVSGLDLNREVDRSAYTAQDMPRYPARVLASHVTMKALQFGSCLGCVAVPAWSVLRKQPVGSVARVLFPASLLTGFAVSYGFTFKLFEDGKLDEAGVDDRAYRITKSAGQVKCDKYSFLGGLAGASTGVILGRGHRGAILASACVGITAGVLLQVSQDLILPKLAEREKP